MNEMPKKIGPYSIFGSLGKGGYGQVYIGRDSKTLQNYAIKVSTDTENLKKEYKILKILCKLEGFIGVYEYGNFESFNYIAMDLLSRNFHYKDDETLLSLKSVIAIGLEILDKIEAIHNFNIIHKDIKPSQFLLSNDMKNIYLVDYGMATFFRTDGAHKGFKTRCNFKGSVMFASINNHMGFRQSRRDDLESLLYSLIYLLKGKLPWVVDSKIHGFRKWKTILNLKLSAQKGELFFDIPQEFELFFKYTRRLQYEQTPNYEYLKGLFKNFALSIPIYTNFDWIIDPSRYSKVVSYVKVTGNKSVLHLKNVGGEFVSTRRNGKLNIHDIRKEGKSVSFKELEQPAQDMQKRKSDIIQSDEKTKSLEKEFKEKSKKRSRKHRSVAHVKNKVKKKNRVQTCDKLLDIISQRPDNIRSPTCILPLISLNSTNSAVSLNEENDPCTPKVGMPEFLNRSFIINSRNSFMDEFIQKVPEKKCEIY